MKLLFYENLSQRLVKRLEASFPGRVHIELIGLRAEPDQTIWDYAGLHGLTIVSKDNDRHQRSSGYPSAMRARTPSRGSWRKA